MIQDEHNTECAGAADYSAAAELIWTKMNVEWESVLTLASQLALPSWALASKPSMQLQT